MTESYGRNTKKIVFTDTDHRHAQLLIRLKHDGLTQADFFRSILTGYIEGDNRVQAYVDDIGPLSKKRKQKSKALRKKGKNLQQDLGLEKREIENIFDLIEEEHPDL